MIVPYLRGYGTRSPAHTPGSSQANTSTARSQVASDTIYHRKRRRHLPRRSSLSKANCWINAALVQGRTEESNLGKNISFRGPAKVINTATAPTIGGCENDVSRAARTVGSTLRCHSQLGAISSPLFEPEGYCEYHGQTRCPANQLALYSRKKVSKKTVSRTNRVSRFVTSSGPLFPATPTSSSCCRRSRIGNRTGVCSDLAHNDCNHS